MGFSYTVLAAAISDNLVVPFVIFGVLVWFALIWWTRADARRRLRNQNLIGASTALAFVPFAGTIMYMILRPPEYLEDAYEREISIAWRAGRTLAPATAHFVELAVEMSATVATRHSA